MHQHDQALAMLNLIIHLEAWFSNNFPGRQNQHVPIIARYICMIQINKQI